MKMIKKIIYVIMVCLALLYVYMMFFSTYNAKYDLTDCVRYFDVQARFRLMLVGDNYYFIDAEKKYKQISNLSEYYYQDETFYGIFMVENEKCYFLFNTKNYNNKENDELSYFDEDEVKVFQSKKMINLDIPNRIERHIRKFIPLAFRKK